MAVVSRPVPSIPTPTIPKRTLSLAPVKRGRAISGSGSRRIVPPTSEAPATPALLCKNSRREKLDFVIKLTPLALFALTMPMACATPRSAQSLIGGRAIDFGNRIHSLFFYAHVQGLSRHLCSAELSLNVFL